MFDHLKTELKLRELEIDSNVNIANVSDTIFTTVINTLYRIKFIGTVISNKQLTSLLTKVLNEGTSIEKFILHRISIPKVHPNILGPGLAQFLEVDISASVMAEQQKGTFFFSILDTKKVRRLNLEQCDLTSVNFVILATAVSCVERANLAQVLSFVESNDYSLQF